MLGFGTLPDLTDLAVRINPGCWLLCWMAQKPFHRHQCQGHSETFSTSCHLPLLFPTLATCMVVHRMYSTENCLVKQSCHLEDNLLNIYISTIFHQFLSLNSNLFHLATKLTEKIKSKIEVLIK